ncbi:CPBP family intramembrane glutamic endopeptidase [Marinoscillum pacificum]|uniref:CPBP family intramembrane glutamic endopeptidase n=1 Tax=Marinoscillum pacificum TaxID=392723 RepID=UPI0021580F5E|nr:CPBP family intramembrane glutamic endopeptidase [Marinoscillum pacificum]
MNFSWKGVLRVLGIIIPLVFIIGVCLIITTQSLGLELKNLKQPSPVSQMYLKLSELIGTCLTLWLFIVGVNKEKLSVLGLQLKGHYKDLVIGLLAGLFIMSGGILIFKLFDLGTFWFTGFDWSQILISVLLFTFVSFMEELLCRGYVQRNLEKSFNRYIALIVASTIFASIHLANPHMDWFSFTYLVVAGLALGWWYMETGNLWFSIGFHFSWNFFQTMFGFNVSGQDFYGIYELETKEENLLNGGDFGFEGSIWAVITKGLIIVFTIWYLNRHPEKKIRSGLHNQNHNEDESNSDAPIH